jgi:hypothetical protein
MSYSIDTFKSWYSNYSLYQMNCDFTTLTKLFGDWFTWNTLNKYSETSVDLNVITILQTDNFLHVYVWINGDHINQGIKIKNIGSELIYLLDDMVASKNATREDK